MSALRVCSVLVLLAGCTCAETPPQVAIEPAPPPPPAAAELPDGLRGVLTTTGTWSGGSWSWVTRPLACVTGAGEVLGSEACLPLLKPGHPLRTFQGRSARVIGPGNLICAKEDRADPGVQIHLMEETPSAPGRPFSYLGDTVPAGWLERSPVDADGTVLERVAERIRSGEGWRTQTRDPARLSGRVPYTADLDGQPGDERIVEAYLNPTPERPSLEAGLFVLRGEELEPMPALAAPGRAVLEVAGVLPLDHGSLVLVLTRDPQGGEGKHVLWGHDGGFEVLSEYFCQTNPAPKSGRAESRRGHALTPDGPGETPQP